MQDVKAVVDELLSQLATAKEVPADAEPAEIITDSLGQMRFLVGLEERLDVLFDDADQVAFDLGSREALVHSVEKLLAGAGL
ncbi:hypothetical protein [Amycolatopsis sp. NPDC052450]|uniref:hypothetical protein n=1 Tax=Amycolatopsis sp. NPDC052450 TaxID=3363937 RepID=UPI0037C8D9FB